MRSPVKNTWNEREHRYVRHWSGDQLGDMPPGKIWRVIFVLAGCFWITVIWWLTK